MAAPYRPSDDLPAGYQPGAARPDADDGSNTPMNIGGLSGAY
jgi:hypothetical protein